MNRYVISNSELEISVIPDRDALSAIYMEKMYDSPISVFLSHLGLSYYLLEDLFEENIFHEVFQGVVSYQTSMRFYDSWLHEVHGR